MTMYLVRTLISYFIDIDPNNPTPKKKQHHKKFSHVVKKRHTVSSPQGHYSSDKKTKHRIAYSCIRDLLLLLLLLL